MTSMPFFESLLRPSCALALAVFLYGCHAEDDSDSDGANVSPIVEEGDPADDSREHHNSGDDPEPDPAVAPDAPALSLGVQRTKQFVFEWEPVNGVSGLRLLEDADGTSGYQQIAVIDQDAGSHAETVFLPARTSARYILEACNDAGCTDSAPVQASGFLDDAVGYFKASNNAARSFFGWSVAMSADGSVLAVSAIHENGGSSGINGDQADNSGNSSGAVYIFHKDGEAWVQTDYIKASNNREDLQFGTSLALSADGSVLAVGATFENSGSQGINGDQTDTSATAAGAVYLFSGGPGNWRQTDYIKASNAESNQLFGTSVALSADGATLAVGAQWEDSSEFRSGAVYVFRNSAGRWAEEALLKAGVPQYLALFGASIALSADGTRLAVGSPLEASNAVGVNGDESNTSVTESGAVFVFDRLDARWSRTTYLKPSNTHEGMRFGSTVDFSDDGAVLAVAAPGERSAGTGIDADQTDAGATATGAAYVFVDPEGVWQQQTYIKASNAETSDHFGVSLDLSSDGATLAIGAYWEDGSNPGIGGDESSNGRFDAGSSYLFESGPGGWRQLAYIKASSPKAYANFGSALALSGDGDLLAVSTPGENSGASGINDDQMDDSATSSGAVYLY